VRYPMKSSHLIMSRDQSAEAKSGAIVAFGLATESFDWPADDAPWVFALCGVTE
jgi:hypothetical protein